MTQLYRLVRPILRPAIRASEIRNSATRQFLIRTPIQTLVRSLATKMATAEPPSTIIIPNNTEIGNGNTADAIDKQTSVQPQKLEWKPRFVDIGINLTDPVYNGIYFDKPRHEDDLSAVVQRAIDIGCEKLIVTGSDLEHSETAVKLAEKYPNTCYATIGIHPCNAQSLTPETLISLKTLAEKSIEDNIAVAFGEIGLDYDRLELCPKETQLTAFSQQLSLAVDLQLPLFLHSRAAHADFLSLLSQHEDRLPKRGVVHSFTGSLEEMRELVARGWHIGVNGCSMKTEENCAVVKEIPLDRLHLETDGPWCEIRPSHTSSAILGKMREDLGFAPKLSGKGKGKGGKLGEEEEDTSMGWGGWKSVKKEKWVEGVVVKGRNESCFIGRVAWAVAGIKGVSVKDVAEAAWRNSVHMFGLGVDLEEEAGAGKTDGLKNGAES